MALMQRYTRSQFVYSTYGQPVLISGMISASAVAKAVVSVGGVTYEAKIAGDNGNLISVEYLEFIPAVAASRVVQDLTYTADTAGVGGNSITITYTPGAVAGAEVVSVLVNAISVQIEDGVSTATNIRDAINASGAAAALVNVVISGAGADPQVVQSSTALLGGTNAIGAAGSEVVTVVGNAISVRLQSGVSTVTQVRTAVNASAPAAALVLATGTSGSPVTAPSAATFLAGGTSGSTQNNCGNLIDSIERTGVGEYTIILKDRYNALQSAIFQIGSGSSQSLVTQVSDVDLSTKTIVVRLLNGTTPTDFSSGGAMFMQMVLNNSSVR